VGQAAPEGQERLVGIVTGRSVLANGVFVGLPGEWVLEFYSKENPVKVKRENLKNLAGLEANSRQAEADRPQKMT
jgi:hypothetical protein